MQQIRQDTVGTVHRGSINCCNNSYATWRTQTWNVKHCETMFSEVTKTDEHLCALMGLVGLNIEVFPSPIFAFLDQVKEGGGGGGYTPTRCRCLGSIKCEVSMLASLLSKMHRKTMLD